MENGAVAAAPPARRRRRRPHPALRPAAFIADRFIKVSEESEAKEDLILAELRAINARLDALEPAPRESATRARPDSTI